MSPRCPCRAFYPQAEAEDLGGAAWLSLTQSCHLLAPDTSVGLTKLMDLNAPEMPLQKHPSLLAAV